MYLYFRYVGLLILIFGLIGNVFTILTLETTKQFYSNPFRIYTIISILNSIFILIIHLGLLIADTFLTCSLRATITWICKLYSYITYFPIYVSITILAVASIDRWFSTCRSTKLRKFSSKRNAIISIIFIVLFFGILLIPHPIYTEVFYDPTRNMTKCNRQKGFYQIYTNYILVLGVHVIPIVVMIIFGYLTYRNLRSGNHLRVIHRITLKERINAQLSRTLIIQIITFIVFIIPNWIVNIIYPAATAQIVNRSAERIAIELFLSNLTMIIYDINFADTFYIFLLVSPAFRRSFKKLLRTTRNTNQIDVLPMHTN